MIPRFRRVVSAAGADYKRKILPVAPQIGFEG
jgi:hypothetical protein